MPEALRSVARRLAYELLHRDEVDPAGFGSPARAAAVAADLIELGVAAPAGVDRLTRVDTAALERIVRVGLDLYRAESAQKA